MCGMRMLLPVAVLIGSSLAGCAKAGPGDGSGNNDGIAPQPDARQNPGADAPDVRVDAPPEVDAPPGVTTFSQTNEVIDGTSVACSTNPDNFTRENAWFRLFDLPALGVTGAFTVSEVKFAVQTSTLAQTISIGIFTYVGAAGTTLAGTPTLVQQSTVAVPVVNSTMITAPITATIPAGSKLLVEVHAADVSPQLGKFFLGTTAGAETAPGYILATACSISTPTSIRSMVATYGAPIITVSGSN